jgi:hypothetical protein
MVANPEIFTEQKEWSLTKESDDIFTGDEVIDAYFQGKKDGKKDVIEEEKRLVLDQLSTNISKSADIMGQIFATFTKRGINPVSGFLRVNSWDVFDMLVTVTESDYLSEEILNLYNYIGHIEEDSKAKYYNLTVSIMGGVEYLDIESLTSDGFILVYNHSDN